VQAQRVEIVVVGNAGIGRRDDFQLRRPLGHRCRRDGILGIQHQAVQVGQDAEHRLAGALLQPGQAGFEQADVAAKTVDDEALDPVLLGRRKQVEGANQVGEDTAPVDVGDEDDRAIDRLGEAHVGDVAVAQVDLGRRAGAFDDDALVGRRQPPPGFEHGTHRPRLVVVIGLGIEIGRDMAVDDDLGLLVGRRLQQHRVEVGMRRQPGGQRLQCLRPADLATIDRDRRIQRHVLRLKRRDAHAPPFEDAAQRRDQRRFAGIGSGALNHQGGAGHGSRLLEKAGLSPQASKDISGKMRHRQFARHFIRS